MGSEAPERDGDLSRVPASAMGICSMECLRRKELQSRKGPSAEAFEAGFDEGYGDGYVDGYDDGQHNQLCGLIREYEEWADSCEHEQLEGILSVVADLRARLEHDP